MSPIIQVNKLSKCYRIGRKEPRYRTFREAVVDGIKAPLRNLQRIRHLTRFDDSVNDNGHGDDIIWALRDVSFDVQPGAVLGIIGRNGAGKSTLLKILSRITEPTAGEIKIYGRVSSLLEVGTGFHPELTGRENIYLSGAILGMRRDEIDRNFSEIVDFSEIGKFLDTPVKHYSSGMYMRLAFAVAAHLESEILLIDEVLAVGDTAFQSKCLDKMGTVSKSGRTVLFVSHNMAAVQRLCSSVMLLTGGETSTIGAPQEVISHYVSGGIQADLSWEREPPYPELPHFKRVTLRKHDGTPCFHPTSSDHLGLWIELSIPSPRANLVMAVNLFNEYGHPIMSTSPLDTGSQLPEGPGVFRTFVLFPESLFLPKRYEISLSMYDANNVYDQTGEIIGFKVIETACFGNMVPTGRIGDVQLQCNWSPFVAVNR